MFGLGYSDFNEEDYLGVVDFKKAIIDKKKEYIEYLLSKKELKIDEMQYLNGVYGTILNYENKDKIEALEKEKLASILGFANITK